MLASPVRRIKKCQHTEVSTYSVAGMDTHRCRDCGELTLTFVEPACVGIWSAESDMSASTT